MEYPEKTHDFRQNVDYTPLHMRTGFESTLLGIEVRTLEVKGSGLTTTLPNIAIKVPNMCACGVDLHSTLARRVPIRIGNKQKWHVIMQVLDVLHCTFPGPKKLSLKHSKDFERDLLQFEHDNDDIQ